jgi:hypothetical protein
MNWEDLPPGIDDVDAATSTFATGISDKLKETREKLQEELKKVRTGTALRSEIVNLRRRCKELEGELDKLNQKKHLPWKLFKKAQTERVLLRSALQNAEAQLVELRARVEAQQQEIDHLRALQSPVLSGEMDEGIEYNLKPLEDIKLPPFEAVWNKIAPDKLIEQKELKDVQPFPWIELLAATAGFIITSEAIPEEYKKTKMVGYSLSTALATSGIHKLIKHLGG